MTLDSQSAAGAEREAKPSISTTADDASIDFSGLRSILRQAEQNGLRRPQLRTNYAGADLTLSLAPADGQNPNYVYVTSGKTYLGKIGPEGDFIGNHALAPALKAIEADPLGAAQRYGLVTGVCSFCGRRLLTLHSQRLGYGPVCAKRRGLGRSVLPTNRFAVASRKRPALARRELNPVMAPGGMVQMMLFDPASWSTPGTSE
jgi:hypothetical protein